MVDYSLRLGGEFGCLFHWQFIPCLIFRLCSSVSIQPFWESECELFGRLGRCCDASFGFQLLTGGSEAGARSGPRWAASFLFGQSASAAAAPAGILLLAACSGTGQPASLAPLPWAPVHCVCLVGCSFGIHIPWTFDAPHEAPTQTNFLSLSIHPVVIFWSKDERSGSDKALAGHRGFKNLWPSEIEFVIHSKKKPFSGFIFVFPLLRNSSRSLSIPFGTKVIFQSVTHNKLFPIVSSSKPKIKISNVLFVSSWNPCRRGREVQSAKTIERERETRDKG